MLVGSFSLLQCFACLRDPRGKRPKKHLFLDMVAIAICAVIAVGKSVRPAAAPSLPMLAGNIGVRFWAQAEAFSATSPHRLFQARAPPLA